MVNTFVLCQKKEQLFWDLDSKRLGKQRVEAMQIINILENGEKGYSNHPAVKMWEGYVDALKVYHNLCIKEWIKRGFVNNMKLYDIDEDKYNIVECDFDGESSEFLGKFDEFSFPPWFSFIPLILSHRASLLRKDPIHYEMYNCPEIEYYYDRGYLWPSKAPDDMYTKWSFDYLDPIGTGAPSHFRISKDDAQLWSLNKTKNPKTGRSIKESATLYLDYKHAAEYYGI